MHNTALLRDCPGLDFIYIQLSQDLKLNILHCIVHSLPTT